MTKSKKNKFNKKEKAFIIEFVPPKYQEVEVKYSVQELKSKYKPKSVIIARLLESHNQLTIKEIDKNRICDIKYQDGYVICLEQVQAEYRMVGDHEIKGDSITITEKRIETESRIIKTYVKKKPEKLNKNQMYFSKGYWVENLNVRDYRCGKIFILKIQKRLNQLGYSVPETNVFEEETRDALIDFQKKNGLIEGHLDAKTLEINQKG